MLEDETFQFDSKAAKDARGSTVLLLAWIKDAKHEELVTKFLLQLKNSFDESLLCLNPVSVNRYKPWKKLFVLRSSEQFAGRWKTFLINAHAIPTPTLYQHLTTLMFHEEVQKRIVSASALTDGERNALRYTAGYICRHLLQQLKRCSHEQNEELILCLMKLTTHKDPDAFNTDEGWTLRVDRGGLWYVQNTTNSLFVAIEEEIRKSLKCLETGSCHKSDIIKSVVASKEVEFYWIISQADFDVGDEETYQVLLYKTVELYLTVRGYSFASNLVEKHKQLTSKGTKKSKAFRRELHDDINNDK